MIIRLIITLLALAGVVSGQSIVQVAKDADPEFQTLVAALTAADLADSLDCTGGAFRCTKYTVFAPTEAAFGGVPTDFFNALLTSEFKTHLQLILYYHLVRGEIKSTDIEDGASVHTLLGLPVTTSTNPVKINDANVVTTLVDIPAENGVIHGIDSVLLPDFLTKTLSDVVADPDGHFTILAQAATTAGLDLSGFAGTTVFAPTDDAFMKLGQARINALLDDPTLLLSILRYHIVDDAIVFQNELEAGEITTREGSSIMVEESRGGWWWFGHGSNRFTLNTDVNIVGFNTVAQNGIIHAIDSVLLPPETQLPDPNIVEIVSAEPALSTLLAAVSQAELVELLESPGPFTVFAPSDKAFENLPAGELDRLLLEQNKPELRDLLSYHVVSGSVLSTDLQDGRVGTLLEVETDIPQRIDVDVQGHKIELNGNTKVTTADITASNGVIHIIDEVLSPPKNIAGIASDDADTFSSLVAAASTAGLVPSLQNENLELTVFAPTNSAFDAFLESLSLTVEDLSDEDNADLLETVVSYHVVSGYVPLRDLTEGPVTTLGNEVLEVDIRYISFLWWRFFVGVRLDETTNIDTFDVFASNGVIHVIDEVLVPPSLRE